MCNRGSGSVLSCSDLLLSRDRSKLEARQERLLVDLEKLDESRRVYRDAGSVRDAVWLTGNCGSAWRSVVADKPILRRSAYLTPSIVVSRFEGTLATGGHNIDGRSLRIIFDSEIPKGRIRISDDGNTLRLHSLDAEKGSAAARIIERARLRFEAGDVAYRQRLIEKAEATLASDTRSVQEFGAVALKLPSAGRNPGSIGVPASLTRGTADSVQVMLTDLQAANFRRVAENFDGDIVVTQSDGVYQTVYPSGHPPFAMLTYSRGANQRDIRDVTSVVADSRPDTSRTVSIVSDGTFFRTDLEAVRLTAETQQVVAEIAGGGATAGPPRGPRVGSIFFGDGLGPKKNLRVFPFSGAIKAFLGRRDADWRGASVSEQVIQNSENQSVARVRIDVPIRQQPSFLRMSFQSFFRHRAATQSDLDTLLGIVDRELGAIDGDKPVQEVIQAVRDAYVERVGTDPTLGTRLQYYATDFMVVELESYSGVETESG